MRHAVEYRTWRDGFGRHARKRVAEFFLDRGREFFHSHAVDHVFQPSLEPVGAVAQIDEHADDGVGDFGRIRWPHNEAGLPGKILVTGDAAHAQAKPDAWLDTEPVLNLHSREGDIVGTFKHGDLAGAVECDVEFSWQSRERAVVENVGVPFAGVLAGVEQFLRIDTCRWSALAGAKVIGAGTARP